MLSCAAVQKLERYGQLAQKRKTASDFVNSSLRDAKRSNIHALTHIPTWQACLEELDPDISKGQDKEKDAATVESVQPGGGDVNVAYHGVPSKVTVSESLLYAVSYATALVVRHMDEQRFNLRNENERNGENVSLDGKVFATPLEEAVGLHTLLWKVAEACGRHTKVYMGDSPQMAQALVHLLSSALDAFIVSTMLRHAAVNDTNGEAALLDSLCRSSTGLVMAVVRQLRVMQSKQPFNALYNVRPCPTLLSQYLSKAGAGMSPTKTTGNVKEVKNTECSGPQCSPNCIIRSRSRDVENDSFMTSCLLTWADTVASGSLIASLSYFSTFQKVSFCDAMVSEAPSGCCCTDVGSFRRTLSSLFSTAACNRATRIVVYFRGDDIKLMQNNVRDSTEYSMLTHVTTPPVERSTLSLFTKLPVAEQHHAALLLAGWIASIPFFFRSFCAEESWTVFAQEQRRMVWLRERETRQDRGRRRWGSSSRANSVSSGGKDDSDHASTHSSDGYSRVEVNTDKGDGGDGLTNSHASDRYAGKRMRNSNIDDDGDRCSVASQLSSFSLMSRASMISTLSKPSIASYREFLSVIDASNTDNGQTHNAPCLHQSEDDNTNLPLILLEEVVLGLQKFLVAVGEAGLSDNLLETTGLRALIWRTIGDLFTFVRNTISFSATNITAKGTPSVFHLGNDLRYNKGLGYEVLGLLFAKVVLPQLLTSCHDVAHETRPVVERALTQCLSTYELIAPQVIDKNVPAILQIASRISKANASSHLGGEKAEAFPTTILHDFLVNLITRLGKGNRISMLLDAIVLQVKEDGNAIYRSKVVEGEDTVVGGTAASSTTVGLREIFSRPDIRAALIEACNVSMDPEHLLLRLLSYVSNWASEEEVNEESGGGDDAATNPEKDEVTALGTEDQKLNVKTTLSRMEPQGVLFILDVVSTVLSGVVPTSISATSILERAAELELALSSFFVNKLHKTFLPVKEQNSREDDKLKKKNEKSSLLLCSAAVIPQKMVHRLVLLTLNAIYSSRTLILSCLQDLGISNLDAYLQLLEESMWCLQQQVDALVGSLTVDDLCASLSITTQMRHAHTTQCPPLIPRFVLQRLMLARSTSMALGFTVGPASSARKLGNTVLSYMLVESEGGVLPDHEADLALSLADTLNEEEWSSLVHFTKPKRVRAAFVWLLQLSFTKSKSAQWLSRCMAACGGLLLEALCEVLVNVDDSELLACRHDMTSKNENDSTGGKGSEDTPLIRLFAALNDVLGRVGHLPQWLPILQNFVHWLMIIYKEERNVQRSMSCLLRQQILQFVLNLLVCEEGVRTLFRWVLLHTQSEENQENHRFEHYRGRKSDRKRDGLNEAFMETVGVQFTVADAMLYASNRYTAEGESCTDAEGIRVAAAKQGIDDCTKLVRRMFSAKFAALLIQQCSTKDSDSGLSLSSRYALGILRQLYTMATTACRYDTKTATSSPIAQKFIISVADKMHACLEDGNYAVLSIFLDAMSGTSLTYVLKEGHRDTASTVEVSEKRRRVENSESGDNGEKTHLADKKHHRSAEDMRAKEETVGERKVFEASLGGVDHVEATEDKNESAVVVEGTKLTEVSLRWVDLLRKLLQEVVKGLVEERHQPQSSVPLLHAMSSLYVTLERVRLPALKDASENVNHRGKGGRANKRGRSYERQPVGNGRSLAAVAVASGELSDTAAKLRKLFAPSKSASRRRSASVLLPMLSSCNRAVTRALWVLYAAYEERRQSDLSEDSGSEDTTNHSQSRWFAALLGSFNVHECGNYDNFCSDATDRLLEEVQEIASQHESECVTLRIVALQRDPAYQTEKATLWLVEQLCIIPEILHTFATSPSQSLLVEYMHALLHASIPLATGAWQHLRKLQDRHQKLLTAVAEALHRLSFVPHMRFSIWRNDAKRLLVNAEAAVVSSHDCSKRNDEGTHSLCCRVLQLCTLPLAALHEDEVFIDHEMSFITSLLFTGTSGYRNGSQYLSESVILRIIRLLSATLLPRHVLWQRAHLLPTLLSFLFTRCLDGVSRGYCSSVVLNQLASFLFQLVKDATHGHCHGISPSLKSLCLSSITSCLFRHSAAYIDVFTTHSNDLDYIAADLLKALQHVHLPSRRMQAVQKKFKTEGNETGGDEDEDEDEEEDAAKQSDATMCDLSYACVGNTDAQLLLRQAAERVEEEEGNGSRHIFLLPE